MESLLHIICLFGEPIINILRCVLELGDVCFGTRPLEKLAQGNPDNKDKPIDE